jgi:hypothetical protein
MIVRLAEADDDSGFWNLARSTLLSDPKEFLRRMLEFDKDSLDQKTIMAIQVGPSKVVFGLPK